MIKALVPLGNKGAEYEKTYHNVGVFVAGLIAREAARSDKPLRLYEPITYMNLSGPAVRDWMRMNNLALDEIVVVHDEGDLVIGEYKISEGGGSAGHNGVASLIAALGSDAFMRLRVGIRNPAEQVRAKTADFVLDQWRSIDEEQFTKVAAQAAREIID